MAFVSGGAIRMMPLARDHKRAYAHDRGPNTGGMGAYAPVDLPPHLAREIEQRIMRPVVDALRNHDAEICGVLFAGLMLTDDGPQVLEFNARFGDPETQ